jgi:hypothetical protein
MRYWRTNKIGLAASVLALLFLGQAAALSAEDGTILSGSKTPIPGVPQMVIPFGEGKLITLSGLNVTTSGSSVKVSINLDSSIQPPYAVIIYLAQGDDLLIINVGEGSNLLFTNMSEESNVLYGFNSGFTYTGDGKKGTLTFSFKKSASAWPSDVYSLEGKKWKLSVFCVKGKVWSDSLLPGEQEDATMYKACSNVLSKDLQL